MAKKGVKVRKEASKQTKSSKKSALNSRITSRKAVRVHVQDQEGQFLSFATENNEPCGTGKQVPACCGVGVGRWVMLRVGDCVYGMFKVPSGGRDLLWPGAVLSSENC